MGSWGWRDANPLPLPAPPLPQLSGHLAAAGATRCRPRAASRHAGARARTRPQPTRSGQRCLPAPGTGRAAEDLQGHHRHGSSQSGGVSPSGLRGTPLSSPARWPPRCCQRLRRLLRPAGMPAPSPSRPLQEPGVPISAPTCQGGLPSCGSVPSITQGGWRGVTREDQALPAQGPGGAGTLLCSWAGSVSSHCKSFVAGPVI